MTRVEIFQRFLGETARPYSIISTSTAAAASTVILAWKSDAANGAWLVGAIYGGLAALYGWKTLEKTTEKKQAAAVEVATVTGSAPGAGPSTVIAPAASSVEVNAPAPTRSPPADGPEE